MSNVSIRRVKTTDQIERVGLDELAHVGRHMDTNGEAAFVDDLSLRGVEGTREDPSEIQADEWAEEALIPRAIWETSAVRRQATPMAVISLANALHIHPAIVDAYSTGVLFDVLAVGDEAFTHKCLDKFAEFRRSGKTILLVTHSLNLVEKFCDDVLWLDAGRIRSEGDPRRVVSAYITDVAKTEEKDLAASDARARERVDHAAPVTAAEAVASGQTGTTLEPPADMFKAGEGRCLGRGNGVAEDHHVHTEILDQSRQEAQVLTLQAGAFTALKVGRTPQVQYLEVHGTGRVEFIGYEPAEVKDVDLTKAEIIVTAGRGIGKKDNVPVIAALAKALGGELGASRPVVDAGWVEHSHQVGTTGQTVSPKLYVACGVSGAIQHLAGMKRSDFIVAINKDKDAPIGEIADVLVVADVMQFVPALTEKLKGL